MPLLWGWTEAEGPAFVVAEDFNEYFVVSLTQGGGEAVLVGHEDAVVAAVLVDELAVNPDGGVGGAAEEEGGLAVGVGLYVCVCIGELEGLRPVDSVEVDAATVVLSGDVYGAPFDVGTVESLTGGVEIDTVFGWIGGVEVGVKWSDYVPVGDEWAVGSGEFIVYIEVLSQGGAGVWLGVGVEWNQPSALASFFFDVTEFAV